MVRRLVFVAIILIGVGIALSQFDQLNKLANAVLASSAVLGLVLGFAAQKILANPLAGILLAISQPIRIGDSVTIEDETGRVDDLTLSHTFIDTGDGRLVIVPNETVVTNVVVNRSTGNLSAPVDGSVWVPPDADLGRAREALARARAVAGRRRRGHARRRAARDPRPAAPGRHAGRGRGGGPARARATRAPRGGSTARRVVSALSYPFGFAMTARQRRRHRRSQGGSVGKKILLGFVVLFAIVDRALGSAGDLGAGRPRRRARIDTLKPAESGRQLARSSPPTAPASATCSRASSAHPVGLDKIPNGSQNATIAIEDENFYEHGGRRLRGDHPRRGRELRGRRGQAGRLDDHPAARPQPLHRGPRGHDRAQDQRGRDGARVRGRALQEPRSSSST